MTVRTPIRTNPKPLAPAPYFIFTLSCVEEEVLSRQVSFRYTSRLRLQLGRECQPHPFLRRHGASLVADQGLKANTLSIWNPSPANLQFLRKLGSKVTGVEASLDGASQLAEKLGLDVGIGPEQDGWERYSGGGIQLYRGLPYDLSPQVIADAGVPTGVWDRWGLIVTPPDLLEKYAEVVAGMVDKGASVLMVGLEHDGPQGIGLYSTNCEVLLDILASCGLELAHHVIEERDASKDPEYMGLREAGATSITELLFHLRRV